MKKIIVLMLGLILALTTVMAVPGPDYADLESGDGVCYLDGEYTPIDDWGVAINDGNYGGVDESEFCLVWDVGCDDEVYADIQLHFAGSNQIIEITHLDGMSDLDSFMVYVDGTPVGTYNDNNDGQETWVTTQFPVSEQHGTHTIRIEIIDEEWNSCDTWGQLAIDEIEVIEDEPDIPEFGVIGAVAVLGLAGLFIARKRH